ncbi:MAG TPA: zf-TFIIB domain-containing protein [Ideonella sp.]|nr:zf-TFIIB domain-containing protein [Ideonella sp.]
MKCPTCPDSTLVMSDRQGVEIDYCPQCRGVWLDRGELDKLIERSSIQPTQQAQPQAPAAAARPRQPDFVDSDYRSHGGQGPYRGRKKSWLSDIFD